VSLPSLQQSFVIGTVQTAVGAVPRVSPEFKVGDLWGTFKARWGIGRMNYKVDPGLYAIGDARADSPVLVTANYKMTFDSLRSSLAGLSAWILVLDTNGINVWCAAGKGTFSTKEVVARIESSGLAQVVTHRQLILPQLSGPGVAAHEVKRLSGFKVWYGPIRSADIKSFIESGNKATLDMRRKTFSAWERVVLIPVELVEALKMAAFVLPAFFLLGGVGGPGPFWANALNYGLFAVVALIGAIVAGGIVTPALLPWLPGRAFSLKGLVPGVGIAVALLAVRAYWWGPAPGGLEMAAWLLIVPAASTYLAMNFTGASTYTSLSGVKKEMRMALPVQISAAAAGIVLWVGLRLIT